MRTAAETVGIGGSWVQNDPAGAGRHDDKRTMRATDACRVNGELMEWAAAVLRTADALGVDPVEFARTVRATTRAMGAAR